MRDKILTKTVFFLCAYLFFGTLWAQALDVPYLSGTVVDQANVLSTQARAMLEEKLLKFEKDTSNQIAVLIIPSLEGENLERYSMNVAETWKLGQKDKDNGVLLLVAKNDRKLRIEVGYGLEGVLTDALSSVIINQEIVPQFKQGNFDEGILNGVDAIILATQNAYKPEITSSSSNEGIPLLPRLIMGLIFTFVVGLHTMNALFTKGAGGWILYGFLSLFWATFPMVIFGTFLGGFVLLLYLVGFPLLKWFFGHHAIGQSFYKNLTTKRSGSNSQWYSGMFTGGGTFGSRTIGSSSSGGFSGGGGSFGGGGSSGSW